MNLSPLATMNFDQLIELRTRQHLLRRRVELQTRNGNAVDTAHDKLIAFCSNDYLSLSQHADVVNAFVNAAKQWGVGAAASPMVCGHHTEHAQFEREIADFYRVSRALFFTNGFVTNLGVLQALTPDAVVLADKFNHASLLDALRFSSCTLKRYRHLDCDDLINKLHQFRDRPLFIVSDGVFSMDGDIAPLPSLIALSKQYNATLVIDDSHGFGVLGKNGAGTHEHFSCDIADIHFLTSSAGKSLGGLGGFVIADCAAIEFLLQHARSYCYSTATPPALAASARASLKVLQQESWRRDTLQQLIRYFREQVAHYELPFLPSATAIQPLVIGEPDRALQLSERLKQRGFLVPAIRPPSVPVMKSRLRVTLNVDHTFDQIDALLKALRELI